MFRRVLPSLFSTVQRFAPAAFPTSSFHSMSATTVAVPNVSSAWSFTSIRTKIRCYFPRPSENKRIKRHGWNARMSTPNGRKILMRRILKGRHTLSH